jgi:hypothetical protein
MEFSDKISSHVKIKSLMTIKNGVKNLYSHQNILQNSLIIYRRTFILDI